MHENVAQSTILKRGQASTERRGSDQSTLQTDTSDECQAKKRAKNSVNLGAPFRVTEYRSENLFEMEDIATKDRNSAHNSKNRTSK